MIAAKYLSIHLGDVEGRAPSQLRDRVGGTASARLQCCSFVKVGMPETVLSAVLDGFGGRHDLDRYSGGSSVCAGVMRPRSADRMSWVVRRARSVACL